MTTPGSKGGDVLAVRLHARGGQGAVTAAEPLSVAAFDEGRHAQAFPTFGSERTGAPVVAFCRIDDTPIRPKGLGFRVAECPSGAIQMVPEEI